MYRAVDRHRRFFSASTILRGSFSFGTVAFEEVRASDKPFTSTALLLHGLLGSGKNLKSFSQNLASLLRSSSTQEWRMVLVDLRNHGRSVGIQGLNPPHDMASAARDLANLVKFQNWDWPDVVIGHSMGGKVALEFASGCARGDYGISAAMPKQLWILDSVPGKVNSDETDGEVEKVLLALQSLPSSFTSRKWVIDQMLNLGFSKLVSKWIGSNLKNDHKRVSWTFDLPAALQMFDSYREKSYWHLLENPPPGLEIAFIRAENSGRWPQHVINRLEALSAEGYRNKKVMILFHLLPHSGHWVHVDNSKGLLDVMVPNFYSMPLKTTLDDKLN